MKRLLPLLLLSATSLFAEQVTVREPVILKAERAVISIKAGTEVELVARDGDTATIKYRNVTGKIPAGKLTDTAKPAPAAEAPKVAEKKPEPAKPLPAKAKESAGPATVPPKSPPQTTYGKAVQKAKDNAAAHDKNAVKPTDEILK